MGAIMDDESSSHAVESYSGLTVVEMILGMILVMMLPFGCLGGAAPRPDAALICG